MNPSLIVWFFVLGSAVAVIAGSVSRDADNNPHGPGGAYPAYHTKYDNPPSAAGGIEFGDSETGHAGYQGDYQVLLPNGNITTVYYTNGDSISPGSYFGDQNCRNRCKFLNIDSLSHRLVVGLLIKAIQTL